MKKYLLTIAIVLCIMALFSQTNSPRDLFVRLTETNGSDVTDFTGMTFTATINSSPNTLTQDSEGCTFLIFGFSYAQIQLGNFTNQWAVGNTVTLTVTRQSDGFVGFADNIVIPSGSTTIYWGRGGEHPGSPVVIQAPPAVLFNTNAPQNHLMSNVGLTNVTNTNGVWRANGWSLNDNWYIAINTVGYTDLTLTSKLRRQYWFDDEDTFEDYWGPRLFRTYYSTDGSTWVQYPVANYTMASSEDWLTIAFDLPASLQDQPNLMIKWGLFNINGISNDGWGEIKDVLVTGMGGEVPPTTYDITVTSTPTGQPIYIDGVDTEEVTPYTFTKDEGWGGEFSVVNAAYTWIPATETVTNLAGDLDIDFIGTFIPIVVTPNPANLVYPPNGEPINRPYEAPAAIVTLEWEAVGLPAPEGYKIAWNGGDLVDIGLVTTWATPAIGPGAYTWQIVPYANDITEPGKRVIKTSVSSRASVSSVRGEAPVVVRTQKTMSKGDAVGCPVWTFTIVNAGPPADIPADTPTEIEAGVEITSPVDLDFGAPTPAQEAIILALPNVTNLDNSVVTVLSGSGEVTFTIEVTTPGTWFGMAYFGGSWHQANPFMQVIPPDPGIFTFTVDFNAKGDVIIFLNEGQDPTLPVELSSFAAILTAQNFVALTWTSESETEMIGYRVYRAESSDVSTAILISGLIDATNTSTTQTYKFEDREVSINNTYYYWLESIDLGPSHMHGPVSVTVTGTVVPELPVTTVMGNVYPNPFRIGNTANLSVSVKAGETANVTVYNILGQVVKSFRVNEGAHNLQWNGRDSKGNLCGSGIYFYKLSSPSMNQTKKMVIMK